VYTIALTFAMFSTRLVKAIGSRVSFPALAEIARARPHRLAGSLRSMRLALIGAAAALLLPMTVGAPWLIELLYDARYADAGWMLQLLAAGAMAGVVSSSAGQALLALGRSLDIALLLASQIALMVGAMALGRHVAGEVGLVAGVACAELLNYPLLALCLRRHGLWQPEIDIPALASAVVALALGVWLT
jgi:O-antigen/teichoic acid export membrane protein